MKLYARWIGSPPRPGDYLMSEKRPRWAYRIVGMTPVSPNVCWDPGAKAEVHSLQFVVDRVTKDAVPRHARIHPWQWDKPGGRLRGESQ